MNKLIPKAIFFLLVIAVAFSGGLLYHKNTVKPASADAENTTITAADPSCIITIDGQRYDVQPLRSSHPGGDIFQCGTDMSAAFHGQHGDNLAMIRKYLVK